MEKDYAEIKVEEDDDFKEGTDENIGHQEKNFASKFKVTNGSDSLQWFPCLDYPCLTINYWYL